jgi:surface protein
MKTILTNLGLQFLILIFLSTLSYSQSTSWTGSLNSDWNNPGNWSAGVPTSTSDVTINDLANDPVISATGAVARTIYLNGPLSISSGGTLDIDNATGNSLSLTFRGVVQNDGQIQIGVNSTVNSWIAISNQGTITNNGVMIIDRYSYQGLNIRNVNNNNPALPADFNNYGELKIRRSGAGNYGIILENSFSTFNNFSSGDIEIFGVPTVPIGIGWGGAQDAGAVMNNEGIIKIGSTGTQINQGILVDYGATFNHLSGQIFIDHSSFGVITRRSSLFNNSSELILGETTPVDYRLTSGGFENRVGGILKGNGMISESSLINQGGRIDPGFPIGKYTIIGPSDFSNSTIKIDVNGKNTAGTDYDQIELINVGTFMGDAVLGGELDLNINFTPSNGDIITILVANSIAGTFILNNSLPNGWTLKYDFPTVGKVSLEYALVAPDYVVTTTNGALVITDVAGNGETLTVGQADASTFIFNAEGRTYSLDGGPTTPFPFSIPKAGLTSVEINAGDGDDVIEFNTYITNMPSLTVNGDAGNDKIYSIGSSLTFLANANLDLDLTNDASPGDIDEIILDPVSNNIISGFALSGTGSAVVKVSKSVRFGVRSYITTVNGDLTVEANLAGTTPGNFMGISLPNLALLGSSGSGNVTVRGRGGNAGTNNTGISSGGATIRGGTSGTLRVEGFGGASPENTNQGIYSGNGGGGVSSLGANVTVLGTGGGTGSSAGNAGVVAGPSGGYSSRGTLTIEGIGGASSGLNNHGVLVQGGIGIGPLTGAIEVTGTKGGNSSNAVDISVTNTGGIVSTGPIRLNATDGGFTPNSSSTTIGNNSTTEFSTFGDNSKFNYYIAGPNPAPNQQTPLRIVGLINLNNVELVLSGSSYIPTAGTIIYLVINDGTDPVQGKFKYNGVVLNQGDQLLNLRGATIPFYINYLGGDGNDVVLSSVPPCITPDAPTFGAITQPTCDVPTGSFTITNYDPSFTYTFAPAGPTINESGVVTADPGIYTITASIASCTSPESQSIEIAAPTTPDYVVTTTNGALVITDAAGNGETLTVGQQDINTFRFEAVGRTYTLNGGAIACMPLLLPKAGLTSVEINAGDGDDVIEFNTYITNMPSLTVNGDAGNDKVYSIGSSVTFLANANLDLDLTNDASPGDIDEIVLDPVSNNIISGFALSGTGSAVVKVSKSVRFGVRSFITTVNGDLTVEANMAGTTPGNFMGISLPNLALLGSSGSGNVTVRGRGGNSDQSNHGISSGGATIRGGISGAFLVEGIGGASSGDTNYGIYSGNGGGGITSLGTDVYVIGTGGGTESSAGNAGVVAGPSGGYSSGGALTVVGLGGSSTGLNNHGVLIQGGIGLGTSAGGIEVTGTKGANSSNAVDVLVTNTGGLFATGPITVNTVEGGFTPNNLGVTFRNNSSSVASTFGNNSKFNFYIGGPTRVGATAGQYHPMQVVGLINLNNAELVISGTSYVPQAGDELLVVINDGTDPVQGTFKYNGVVLNQGDQLLNLRGATIPFYINYLGGDGNDVVLSSVPPCITPDAPTFGAITQPTCDVPTGSFTITNYDPSFTYTFAPAGPTIDQAGLVTATPGIYTLTAGIACGISLESSVEIAAPTTPDYVVTTTNGALVITDVAGNGEKLTVSRIGGNISFNAVGRTYSLDGGPMVCMPVSVSMTGLTSVEINAADGDDIIEFNTYITNMPSLTINGGPGNDKVYNIGASISFKKDANLDLDLTNDAAPGDIDEIVLDPLSNDIISGFSLSGSGSAVVKVSKSVTLGVRSFITTIDGDLLVEANMGGTTTGNFIGVSLPNLALIGSSKSGKVTVRGRGGNTGDNNTGISSGGATIRGGTSGALLVEGFGGSSSGNTNNGIYSGNGGGGVSSLGANVIVRGTGGGTGSSAGNAGVVAGPSGGYLSGGTLTIFGQGGNSTGLNNHGVLVQGGIGLGTSTGAIEVTGTKGANSSNAVDISVTNTGGIVSTGPIKVNAVNGGFSPNNLSATFANGSTTVAPTFGDNSKFNYYIAGPNPAPNQQTPLRVVGLINLNNVELVPSGPSYIPPAGTVIFLVINDGADLVQGKFKYNGVVLNQGDPLLNFRGSTVPFYINYQGGDGNDVVLTSTLVAPRPFITTWRTLSAGESITIPTLGGGYNYTVNWGDGTIESNRTGSATHAYATAGTYTVSISGDFPRIYLPSDAVNAAKLVSIDQWGDIVWQSMASAFGGAVNLVYLASDAPNLSLVTDMSYMFALATLFNGNINSWDVSTVTNMNGTFAGATSFNSNLNSWNVSNVTEMSSMFAQATSFNGDVSSWNVSKVKSLNSTFASASSFDGDISSWDVSNVEKMRAVFAVATRFNQNLSSWDVANVTDMTNMFLGARSFNSDLSTWNVAKVTNMRNMFSGATSFNSDLSAWDVSNVTDMSSMLNGARSFDSKLGTWNVANVTAMSNMLNGSGLTQANYDNTLIGWSQQSVRSGVTLGADKLNYCDGLKARDLLISKGWTILGDTEKCAKISTKVPKIKNGRLVFEDELMEVNAAEMTDAAKPGMKLYPNPASTFVNIQLEGFKDDVPVSIIDQLGRTIWTGVSSSAQRTLQVDLANGMYASGVYMVRIATFEGIITKRLIIN